MVASVGDALGVYISVPFCRSKCTYCNFASGSIRPKSTPAMWTGSSKICGPPENGLRGRGWSFHAEWTRSTLGGGTPSLLAPELLARLFAAVRTEFDLEPAAEITVECAPGQLAAETLEALTASGVNRVSLGVQSFIDREGGRQRKLHQPRRGARRSAPAARRGHSQFEC